MHCVVMKSQGYFILTYVTSIGNQLSNACKDISENFNMTAVREQNGLDTHFKGLPHIIVCYCGLWDRTNFSRFALKSS